jgi:hypothetical protein
MGPVTDPGIRSFDAAALFAALDARRTELGLSWRQVADQLWEQSAELNERRRDHPISPSTLTAMASKPRATCQHALFMLRWLDRTPESFLEGGVDDDPRFALPTVGSDRRLRWNLRLLYQTMDDKRREDGMTWPEVAAALGCTPSQVTGLRTAKFATGIELAMRIAQWTGHPAAYFVYAARW